MAIHNITVRISTSSARGRRVQSAARTPFVWITVPVEAESFAAARKIADKIALAEYEAQQQEPAYVLLDDVEGDVSRNTTITSSVTRQRVERWVDETWSPAIVEQFGREWVVGDRLDALQRLGKAVVSPESTLSGNYEWLVSLDHCAPSGVR